MQRLHLPQKQAMISSPHIFLALFLFLSGRVAMAFSSIRRPSRTNSRPWLCMTTTNLQDELTVAISTARKAGIAAKRLQKTLIETKRAAIEKSDSSPVTIADYTVQALVIAALRVSFPGDQVVAEETSGVLRQDPVALAAVMDVFRLESGETYVTEESLCEILDHGRLPGPRTWILDPIDGTKGFIRGEHFCVALGMALEGKPVLGVLACPNVPSSTSRSNGASLGDGCVFFALKGQGAFMLPLEANGSSLAEEITHAVPIRVSPATAGEEARFFESVETAHSSHSVGAEAARALGVITPPVQMDSQCKYGLLARGEGEVMLRLPRLGYIENIWDHAPAYVVITEAGGRVTDTEGKELDFADGCRTGTGKMGREVTGIVTTNGRLHDLVVESLRSFWPPRGG